MTTYHEPVMTQEVVEYLDVKSGRRYCDATLGGGGHTRALLERSAPDGQVLSVDRDSDAIAHAQEHLAGFGSRLTLRQGNFSDLCELLRDASFVPVDGLVVDLGVSSHQLDVAERGFSFAAAGPIDMRMDQRDPYSAKNLISDLSERDLANLIYLYGEERHSRRIAKAIKEAYRSGALTTTTDLSRVIRDAIGPTHPAHTIHPATRTFQALRIGVNRELENLEKLLSQLAELLRPGGRIVVIAFHSLEDRTVKEHFHRLAGKAGASDRFDAFADQSHIPMLRLLTRKPVRATPTEISNNPRARSARLRAAERL